MQKGEIITISGVITVLGIVMTLFYIMGKEPERTKTTVPVVSQNDSMNTQPVSELKIDVLTEGQGAQIVNGQQAVVYYVGTLDDGKVFDKNDSGEGFVFPLGAGRVIQGWDLGVLGMKVGEKRRLTIPANLGYGVSGFPGVIPGNATLHFDVELRAIR